MNIPQNDNYEPSGHDRLVAIDLVRRIVEAGDAIQSVSARLRSLIARRLEYVVLALQLDGLAVIHRAADGRPLRMCLTEYGTEIGEWLMAGDTALLPATGGIKVVAAPKRLRLSADGSLPDGAVAHGRPALILARAPAHYGEDTVDGSATHVIIDGVTDWSRHPTLKLCTRPVGSVRRAWEVFSADGLSFGLVLETPDGFEGVDRCGSLSCEDSVSEAAWQVRVNC